MQDKILNITNGDYFNAYFMAKFGGVAIPFCENMMDGAVLTDLFSDRFVKLRCAALKVTEGEYRQKMRVPEALAANDYAKICLWFGKDTFCQMNLLALLAYLEQIDCRVPLTLYYVDDETLEVIEGNIDVTLGRYRQIYQEIFLSRALPRDLGVLHKRAIELYFDYHSQDGMLSRLVRENADKTRSELICLLLGASKEYGLSDLQAEGLIDNDFG